MCGVFKHAAGPETGVCQTSYIAWFATTNKCFFKLFPGGAGNRDTAECKRAVFSQWQCVYKRIHGVFWRVAGLGVTRTASFSLRLHLFTKGLKLLLLQLCHHLVQSIDLCSLPLFELLLCRLLFGSVSSGWGRIQLWLVLTARRLHGTRLLRNDTAKVTQAEKLLKRHWTGHQSACS